jgi:transglycosylase-like protein with SLT domain
MPSPRFSVVLTVAAVAGVCSLAPARAELVILDDGAVVKVKAYELEGETARLTLPSGGRMTLALGRVERVVDDEVVPEPEPPPALAAAVPPPMELRFQEAQAVPQGPYGPLIYEAARRNALNPQLVAAVLRAESAGDPRAVSRKGARGLMQLMPATARRFGVGQERLLDPRQNLEAGSRYLRWLVDQFPGDLVKVLAAYNAGEATVERYQGVPPYRETRDYIRRIYTTLGLTLASL